VRSRHPYRHEIRPIARQADSRIDSRAQTATIIEGYLLEIASFRPSTAATARSAVRGSRQHPKRLSAASASDSKDACMSPVVPVVRLSSRLSVYGSRVITRDECRRECRRHALASEKAKDLMARSSG